MDANANAYRDFEENQQVIRHPTEYLADLKQDLRYAARGLQRNPGFTAVAVLTLALGIGANTAIFSVIRSVLLRPLPYDEPDRIVQVWNAWSNEPGVERGRSPLSELDIADARDAIRSFDRIAAYTRGTANLTGTEDPDRVAYAAANAGIFDVLGTDALIGRTFSVEEDVPGRGNVVVLSHGLWQRRFGADPSVVGATVHLDGSTYTVVGVMPQSFRLPEGFLAERPVELWMPLALDVNALGRGNRYLHALARLRSGASVETANAELEVLTRRWIDAGFLVTDARPFYAVPIEDEIFGDIRPALLILFAAVVCVLLITCVNVASLLLARSDERRREMAVRAALGAARGRLVAQLLTESTLLAVLGGACGLLLGYLGVQGLIALDPAGIPRLAEVRLDGLVLAFTALVAVAAGILFGLVPAIQASRPDLVTRLKESGRGSTSGRGRQRFRGALVAAEVALSAVLVIAAALMIRTFWELHRIDLGVRPDNILTAGISLPATDYAEKERVVAFYRQLIERLEALPGVSSAAAVNRLPLVGEIGNSSLEIEGRAPPLPGESPPHGGRKVVTSGYFETMGLTLVRGHFLESVERVDGLPVAVINQSMAEAFWPGQDPIGKRFRMYNDNAAWFTVVGVVGDVRQAGVVREPAPTMYYAHEQYSLATGGDFVPLTMSLVVRTEADPLALAGAVRGAAHSLDPNLPVADIRDMDDIVSAALSEPRFVMLLLGIFAVIALSLAAVGIYGVISYAVGQRTHEIGLRMALGAEATDVLRMMVGNGMVLALVGVGAGVLVAIGTTKVLSGLLYGVGATDPATFIAVSLVLTAVAFLASYLPARRVTRVNPMIALRAE